MKRYFWSVMAVWALALAADAQNWVNVRTLPPGRPSAEPALSHDGRYIFWGWEGGLILWSNDRGVTWQTNSIQGVTNIHFIACSTNGLKAAIAADDGIYVSSDAGEAWRKTTAPAHAWSSVAMSADGEKLAASDLTGTSGIYGSVDFGESWTQLRSDGAWRWVASSADGSILAAAHAQLASFSIISTNSGSSWANLPIRAAAIAMSADGSKMIAAPYTTHSNLLTSTNSGSTWIDDNGFGQSTYASVAISADGRILFARSSIARRFIPETGETMSHPFTGLTSAKMSGDGMFMAASHAAAISILSEERPIIVRRPVALTVWPRTNLNFTASVTGATPINFRWTFDDQPVGSNAQLLPWSATNSGVIKLTVENSFGAEAVTHTILEVLPIGARMNLAAVDNWPFSAVVAPGFSDTAVWFEWGVGNNFDRATTPTNLPAGPIRALSIPAPPMSLGVYNVRVVASNSVAMVVGPPQRFVPSPITATMDTGTRPSYSAIAFNWFEQGYAATNRSLGLPRAGSVFRSESEKAAYQMPPDYGSANALLVDAFSSGSLRLVTPAAFSKLSILTSAGSGDVVIRYVVRHTGGSTETGEFTSHDWFDGTNTAFTAHARLNPDIRTPLAFPTSLWRISVEPGNPRLYGRTIDIANAAKPIETIEFARVSGVGHAAIFAVSGLVGDEFVPIPVAGFTHDMVVEAEFSGEPQIAIGQASLDIHALPGVRYQVRETDSLDDEWRAERVIMVPAATRVPVGPIDLFKPSQFFQVRIE